MMRVAAYCRVSTDKTDQIHSFNSQKMFFSRYIESKSDWILTGIYSDEGMTGTTAERGGFMQMIADASHGKFDIIMTKEVSRFSRNILDAISYTRKLKELGVGVIFFNDGISTLDPDAELRLGIMASVAQEESRRTSERVRWGQTRQMERGVVFGRSLLGYDVKNGMLTIEPEGAATVRRIFSMYIDDRLGVRAIAKSLSEKHVPTKSGGLAWSGAAVLKIIRNEKYCGDLLQKKTVTADYLTHKKKANHSGDRIYIRDHHEPVISREDWESAQVQRNKRKHHPDRTIPCGNRYALSGRIFCAGCGASYYCRTRIRHTGGTYRVWNCLRCSCSAEKRGYVREDTLIQCIRYIMKSYDRKALAGALTEIIARIFDKQDTGIGDYEKKTALLKGKLLKLLAIYLDGEISMEEYAAMKSRYEAELESCSALYMSLQAYDAAAKSAMAIQITEALAAGEADDADFYLSLVEHIDIIKDTEFDIYLVGLTGRWSVEIS
jgi:DNA invertase Pin-like site-specific DNA recombinase